jgi:hypothetical protein
VPFEQKAFGTNYGLTSKVPKDAVQITAGSPKEHAADNGSGMVIHREFCDNCGSFILEYGVRTSLAFHPSPPEGEIPSAHSAIIFLLLGRGEG